METVLGGVIVLSLGGLSLCLMVIVAMLMLLCKRIDEKNRRMRAERDELRSEIQKLHKASAGLARAQQHAQPKEQP